MNLMKKINGQKGEANMLYVVVAILIVVGVFYALKHYQDRNHDIVIHVPHVEVH